MANVEATHMHSDQKSYVTGFILSLLLTLIPFFMVYYHTVSGNLLVAAIIIFALLQLGVQVVFFLHLGRGSNRRWNQMAFLFMSIVVLTVVIGSIWIMYHLQYNMSPEQMDQQLLKQQDL